MALKSLVHQVKELKGEFLQHKEGLKALCLIVSLGFGHKEYKNTYNSGMILMSELEYDFNNKENSGKDSKLIVFKDIIEERVSDLKLQYEQMEIDTKGKKFKLHESINRLQSWIEGFERQAELYKQYS